MARPTLCQVERNMSGKQERRRRRTRQKKARMMKLQRILGSAECTDDGGSVAVLVAAARTPQGRRDGQQWEQFSRSASCVRVFERADRAGWSKSGLVSVLPSGINETSVAANRCAQGSPRATESEVTRHRQRKYHTERWNDQWSQSTDVRVVSRPHQGETRR